MYLEAHGKPPSVLSILCLPENHPVVINSTRKKAPMTTIAIEKLTIYRYAI